MVYYMYTHNIWIYVFYNAMQKTPKIIERKIKYDYNNEYRGRCTIEFINVNVLLIIAILLYFTFGSVVICLSASFVLYFQHSP